MTEETLSPPLPRSTDHWTVPKVVRIEGDGINPRNTKLYDGDTGEELKLPVHALRFNVTVDEPNSMEIVLAGVAMRATVHLVHYEISEADLAELARQNGYRIEAVPAYPARMTSYGPAEVKITFRDLPKMPDVIHRSTNLRNAIEQAEVDLHGYIERLKGGRGIVPAPSEAQEGEFLIWAHAAP